MKAAGVLYPESYDVLWVNINLLHRPSNDNSGAPHHDFVGLSSISSRLKKIPALPGTIVGGNQWALVWIYHNSR